MTIPIPPPQSAQPGRGRHAGSAPRRSLGITRIEHRSDLPDGVNALASADGATIIVRAGLDKASRRSAIREILAATHRFPSLVLVPVLVDSRVRRFLFDVSDAVSGAFQHLAVFLAPSSPVTAIVASVAVLAAGAGAVGVATGVLTPSFTNGNPANSASPGDPGFRPLKPVHAHMKTDPDYYLGVYEASSPSGYGGVTAFGQTIARKPNLALYYSGWDEPFNSAFADSALSNGATPVIQINPDNNTSIAGIADGAYNKFLDKYAVAVHAYGKNVVIGFGHEMNGDWYPWGWGRTSPQVFVRAWRHIVNLFRYIGDYNVTWMWTVNGDAPGTTGSIRQWWPGSSYVTWVGIDSYYLTRSDTFMTVFGPTIAQVHQVAPNLPILIAETAADPPEAPEAEQISGLFQGIRNHAILGFIWYDEPGVEGEWRLEGNPPAISAFRKAALDYG